MRRVSYAGETFITSDEVADAVLEYAAALSNADRAATLEVPTIGEGGPTTVKLLIGPASQVVSEPVAGEAVTSEGAELDARTFLADVREAIRHHVERPRLPEQGSALDWDI